MLENYGIIKCSKEDFDKLEKEDFIKFLNGVQFELDTKEKIVTIYFNGAFKGLGIVEDNIMKRFIVE